MAEFNPDDSTLKWYNVLSSKFIHSFEPLDLPSTSAAAAAAATAAAKAATAAQLAPNSAGCKEESSDESTITSSQTSTLTRNQAPPPLDIQAQICEELPATTKLRRSGMVNVAKMMADANSLGSTELPANSDESDDEDDDDEDDEDEDEEEEVSEAKVAADEDQQLEVGGEYTKKMLDAYMENMKQEFVDKETNTECAFPPEKSRSQAQQQLVDDRPVKRSQTFTPSAAVGKSRYICRLNRSDSDSAMHFGVTPHPFHRGAVERRSLRFQTKATKSVTKLHQTHIPRTSLDLELDLQAQHSKLDFLNDQIEKLQNLKEV